MGRSKDRKFRITRVEPLEARFMMHRGGDPLSLAALQAARLDAVPGGPSWEALDATLIRSPKPGPALLGGPGGPVHRQGHLFLAGPVVRPATTPAALPRQTHRVGHLTLPGPAIGPVVGKTPRPTPGHGKAPAPPKHPAKPPAHKPTGGPTIDALRVVAVGGTLETTIRPGGLAGPGVAYIITPQPLPANATFDRGTGAFRFAPAPGQAGHYEFTVTATKGARTVVERVPLAVVSPRLAATEVTGRVVDEAGRPLAGIPVMIGMAMATTDAAGAFVLKGVPANPGPLTVDGLTAGTRDRMMLMAPVAQTLGHRVYAGADNAVPGTIILPRIDTAHAFDFSKCDPKRAVDVTNPALPGVHLQFAAGCAMTAAGTPFAGKLALTELPAGMIGELLPPGVTGSLLEFDAVGLDATRPVRLTMPNTKHYAPGSVLQLWTMNWVTGAHDLTGRMVVSADGRTMSSTGGVTLPSGSMMAPAMAAAAGPGRVRAAADPAMLYGTAGCFIVTPSQDTGSPTTPPCGCGTGGNRTTPAGNVRPVGATVGGVGGIVGGALGGGGFGGLGGGIIGGGIIGSVSTTFNSDANLATGEYLQDHPLVTYQSQGQHRGLDLQYSSLQANPLPVVQYNPTTQVASDSSAINSVTAGVSVGGVSQGAQVTYNLSHSSGGSSLTDGQTFRVPLQVNATQLASGVYPYYMSVTQNYSGGASTSSSLQGDVDVINAAASPLGAGWSIGGLQQLSQVTAGGPALITAGAQGAEQFDPKFLNGPAYLPDLAVATGTGTQAFANDNQGNFAAAAPATASTAVVAGGVAAGDFNGDGLPDLAEISAGAVTILLNNGLGGFTAGSSYALTAGFAAKAVAVGNFTGHTNGVLDLAVLEEYTDANGLHTAYVEVWTGGGTGTFANPIRTLLSTSGGVPGVPGGPGMAVGDFNGDGKTDLAAVVGGQVHLILASGGGSMTDYGTLTLPAGHQADTVAAVDYNGDGKPDLVVAATNTNVVDAAGYFLSLDLYQGTGSGNLNLFTATSSYLTSGHPAGSALVTGNFLTPTDVDVAVAVAGDSSQDLLQILPVGSNGTWQQQVTQAIPAGLPASTLVAADLNGDGRADLALASDASGGGIGLILSNPDSNQLEPMQVIPIASSGGGVAALAVAPFAHHASVPEYKDTMGDDPSTLIHNPGGTWSRSYPDGTVVQFNAAGRETSETDRNGNATTYAYVPAGQPGAGALQSMIDPVGLATTLAYNAAGHLSTVTDPAGRVTTFTVDSNGNLTKVVDPDGAVTQYGYATPANHEITTEVNPDNKTATAHYDSFGQLHSETLFDGATTIPIGPADEQGLLAPGGSSSTLPSPAGYAGTLTDADGRTTTMALDMMSNPTAIQDPTGARTTTAYDMMGRPATVTDGDGRATAYTYNMLDNVTSIRRPDFLTQMTMAYGVDDQLTQVVDFKGQATTYTLDGRGNVLRRTDPDLGHEDFTYNAAGQVLTDTDRDGHATTYTYDSYGRLTRVNDPFPSGGSSPSVAFGYDAAGDVTTGTDELGHTTTMAYDPAGRLLSTQDPVQGAAGPNVKTAYAYDPAGNLLGVTDALGHQTTYAYDARNREVGMTDPADQGTGRQYAYGYDGVGNLTSVTDPLGYQATFAYDGMNRQLGVTDPTGARTTYAYDGAGQLLSVIDPNGNPTTYTYDQDGRLQTRSVLQAVVVHQGSGGSGGGTYTTQTIGVTTYAYDNDDNLIQVAGPQGEVVDYGYDALNRRTSMTRLASTGSGLSGGSVWLTTSYGYDAVGNRTTVTDPDNHITTSAYDERNRLVAQAQPSGGGTTTYAYDAHSRLLSLTDPDHNTTSYGYDNANRVTTVTDPLGHVTTTAHDVVGNVTGVTDRDNRAITYAYDPDNRKVAETWYPAGGGAALRTATLAYDADGRLTSIQDPNSAYAYTYDHDGRVLVVDNAGTPGMPHVLLTYAYDPVGNRTGLADNSGGSTTYAYDLAERLTGIALAGTGLTAVQATMAYDTANRLTGLTRLSGSAAVGATTYAYDLADRLTGLTHANAAGGTISSYAYTLDNASRLTQEARAWANPGSGGGTLADTLTYAYTNNNQLTGVTHTNGSFASETFGYDANGNRNTAGYTAPVNNELTGDGVYTYAYDAEGNLVSKTAVSGGGQTLYAYDDRNRLTEVDRVVGGVRSVVGTYTYDAQGRQIGAAEGGAVRWTAYDGQTPILDFNGAGAVTARYLSVPQAIDQVLARETPGGMVAWYLADRLGTERDLVNSSGGVIDHVDYGAFGNVVGESSTSNGDRIKFAGMELDQATGLYYDRARWYGPVSGRFISQDPAGFAAGDPNLDRYVGNSPLDYIDALGLWYWDGNVGRGGYGGGIQTGPSNWGPCYYQGIHPYFGFQGPGASVSYAPGDQTITPGINAGFGGFYGIGGQVTIAVNPIYPTTPPSVNYEVGAGIGEFGFGGWLVFGDANPLNYYIWARRWWNGQPTSCPSPLRRTPPGRPYTPYTRTDPNTGGPSTQ